MSASDVTSTVDDRQDPVSKDLETPCPVCVKSGFACAVCSKPFVLFDLTATTPDGQRHLSCAQWGLISVVNLFSMDEHPDSPFGRRLASDGFRLAARANDLLKEPNQFRRELCIAQAAYYSRDLCADRAVHRPHIVGGPDRGCDFCSTLPVARTWRLRAFHYASSAEPGSTILRYEGDWNACASCVASVEKKDVAALARGGLSHPAAPGLTDGRRRKHYTRLYAKVVAEIGVVA